MPAHGNVSQHHPQLVAQIARELRSKISGTTYESEETQDNTILDELAAIKQSIAQLREDLQIPISTMIATGRDVLDEFKKLNNGRDQ